MPKIGNERKKHMKKGTGKSITLAENIIVDYVKFEGDRPTGVALREEKMGDAFAAGIVNGDN